MGKILNILGLAADLAFGVLCITIGTAIAVGGMTGALWM